MLTQSWYLRITYNACNMLGAAIDHVGSQIHGSCFIVMLFVL